MMAPSLSSTSSSSRCSAAVRAITNGAVATNVRLPCQRQERGALLLVDEGWKDEDEWILADLNNVVFVARALRHCQAERAEPAGREKRNLQV